MLLKSGSFIPVMRIQQHLLLIQTIFSRHLVTCNSLVCYFSVSGIKRVDGNNKGSAKKTMEQQLEKRVSTKVKTDMERNNLLISPNRSYMDDGCDKSNPGSLAACNNVSFAVSCNFRLDHN